jgi:uncharacterized membrane protein
VFSLKRGKVGWSHFNMSTRSWICGPTGWWKCFQQRSIRGGVTGCIMTRAIILWNPRSLTVYVVVARNHRINYSQIGGTFQHVLFDFLLSVCVCISNTWMMNVSICWTLSHDIYSLILFHKSVHSKLSVVCYSCTLDLAAAQPYTLSRGGGGTLVRRSGDGGFISVYVTSLS